jgi:hypothetical protein
LHWAGQPKVGSRRAVHQLSLRAPTMRRHADEVDIHEEASGHLPEAAGNESWAQSSGGPGT